MIVRPLSTMDNTRDYARVSHSRQWSNYNKFPVPYSRIPTYVVIFVETLKVRNVN